MKAKHRFFIKNLKKTDVLILEDQELVHQCLKVLRLKSEDFIILFNGQDNTDYAYKITDISKKSIQLQYIKEHLKNTWELDIHIYQAIPNKLSKLEFIVQKCSEVWVKKITFFKAHYSQDTKFLNPKKIERLEKIAIESAEQSHRNSVLELDFRFDFQIQNVESDQILCFHTIDNDSRKIANISINTETEVTLFVWPEWGFHNSEIDFLKQKKTRFIHLWNNILRTESVGFWTAFFIIQKFLNT